ncbi:MAG: hypothetical protein ABL985_19280 [Casimicrobium sp.]
MTVAAQLDSLKAVCPDASEVHEAGSCYVHLPQLSVPVGDQVKVMDALLAVTLHSGYSTRLFLSEQILERPTIGTQAANWTQHQILGKNWWTWSWQGVPANLVWIQILLAHLKALK